MIFVIVLFEFVVGNILIKVNKFKIEYIINVDCIVFLDVGFIVKIKWLVLVLYVVKCFLENDYFDFVR